MSPRSQPTEPVPELAAARLERLLRSNACIVYHENLPDRDHPQVKCSVYGAPKTNELFVRVSNGRISFVAVAPSPVEFPAMADRVFGLDAGDHTAAFGLADQLWLKHRTALLGR